ncbi:MAG: hypothetical protein JW986_07740 [Methanotrichaceae archaeon]|nr:hypothetical protein [Methanotrichaceae archaeon]
MRVLEIILVLCIAAVAFIAGCAEQGERPAAGEGPLGQDGIAGDAGTPLAIKIISPKAGDILTGSAEFPFESETNGGTAPYSYSWSSNINGQLGNGAKLSIRPSDLKKGQHNIILKVTDSSGVEAQASVLIRAM